MTFPNDQLERSVILDASVLINLVVVDDPVAVLRAMQKPMVVAEAAREVRRNPRSGIRGDAVLAPLFAGPLELIEMTESEAEVFVSLVGAPAPDDLDDGEAATLACAVQRDLDALVDERKANRIITENFEDLRASSTVALYRDMHERAMLPQPFVASCVFDSLRFARMRVASNELDWVCSLLTLDQLDQCPSLPRRARSR